jgi:hypothetical protein
MAIVRAIDVNGDWTFGAGINNYYKNQLAIAQNIETRLNSYLGDCFFDLAAGINWLNLLGEKDLTSLKVSISTVILNTTNVTGIQELSLVLTESRRLTVKYAVITVYSVYQNTFEFNVQPTSNLPA